MKKVIFWNYGIRIIQDSGKLYLQCEEGQAASRWREAEISLEDSNKAQESGMDAYWIIIKYGKAGMFRIMEHGEYEDLETDEHNHYLE